MKTKFGVWVESVDIYSTLYLPVSFVHKDQHSSRLSLVVFDIFKQVDLGSYFLLQCVIHSIYLQQKCIIRRFPSKTGGPGTWGISFLSETWKRTKYQKLFFDDYRTWPSTVREHPYQFQFLSASAGRFPEPRGFLWTSFRAVSWCSPSRNIRPLLFLFLLFVDPDYFAK